MIRGGRFLASIAIALLMMGLLAGCMQTAQDRQNSREYPQQRDDHDGGMRAGGGGGMM